MAQVKIVHLYAKEMNIYGDNGNVLILKKRLEWRGYEVEVQRVNVGDTIPEDCALIVGGGGQDKGQLEVARDLQDKKDTILRLKADGVPMLMICGMYQLFGHYFKTNEDGVLDGIGALDCYTVAGEKRIIGNIVIESSEWGSLVGYENHSGRTYLGKEVKPIGRTEPGQGNNGEDQTEGACSANVFGSYSHGPLLAKSPDFADYLLTQALKRLGFDEPLNILPDKYIAEATNVARSRPR
jgi:lipid II isoglutaminyl synthase (glutamine-hydrolysing)